MQHAVTTEGCFSSYYYEVLFQGSLVEIEEGLFIKVGKIYDSISSTEKVKKGELIAFKIAYDNTINLKLSNEIFNFKPKVKKKDKLHKHWVKAILHKLSI